MAKNDSVHNIDDLFDLSRLEQRWQKPEDYVGISLVLKDASKRSGARGDYFVMTVTVEETGEDAYVSTGASQPSLFMSMWSSAGKPEVRFTFAKDGDKILMVRPVD